VRPIDDLRRTALAMQPPAESGSFLPTDLVDVTSLDSTIKLDIRYATPDNFLGTPVYTQPRAFLQRPAAEALVRVNRILRRSLRPHDPRCVSPVVRDQIFWDATPPEIICSSPTRRRSNTTAAGGRCDDVRYHDRKGIADARRVRRDVGPQLRFYPAGRRWSGGGAISCGA